MRQPEGYVSSIKTHASSSDHAANLKKKPSSTSSRKSTSTIKTPRKSMSKISSQGNGSSRPSSRASGYEDEDEKEEEEEEDLTVKHFSNQNPKKVLTSSSGNQPVSNVIGTGKMSSSASLKGLKVNNSNMNVRSGSGGRKGSGRGWDGEEEEKENVGRRHSVAI